MQKSYLSKYETDVKISLTSIAPHIELVIDSDDNCGFTGWNILPHLKPCAVSLVYFVRVNLLKQCTMGKEVEE